MRSEAKKITQNVLEILHSQELPGRTYIKRTDVKPKNTMPPALAVAMAEASKLEDEKKL